LQVIKYGKFNWVRHWLLQTDPREVDNGLFASASLTRYLSFITDTIRNVRAVMRDDGYFCLVVGDVRRDADELNLAREIARNCFQGTDLRVLATVRDALPVQHKVSRIWGATRGRATRIDRIIVAYGPQAKPLTAPERIEWSAKG
jgi:site-specific DNA-methyltransferase (adenine-specific)